MIAQILIVGAGPTGLAMAAFCHKLQVPFRIIETKAEPTETSNAIGIQARTLEILAELDLADRFIAAGNPMKGAEFLSAQKRVAELSFEELPTRFPMLLLLTQAETERFFIEHLTEKGVHIEWNTTLTELTEAPDHVDALLETPEGTESARFQWIIGCDGFHSVVRRCAHIEWDSDADFPQQFALADFHTTSTEWDEQHIHLFFTAQGLAPLFPMGNGSYRLLADLPLGKKIQTTPQNHFIPDDEIHQIIQERIKPTPTISTIDWSSTFWIHSKVAEHVRSGRLFLAGDAAHVHSPAGGQGMNTGIQDAYNLSFKLALIYKHQTFTTKLLDSYEVERLPLMRQLVKKARLITRAGLFKQSWLIKIRNHTMHTLLGCKWVQKQMAMQISQLGIHYKGVKNHDLNLSFVDANAILNHRAPKPGHRMPDLKDSTGRWLSQRIQGFDFQILIFRGDAPETTVRTLESQLKQQYSYCMQMHVITDTLLFEALHLKEPSVIIVRPDKYILGAYTFDQITQAAHFLAQFGIVPM